VLSLDNAIVRPPVGAGLPMVTVPVEGVPPTTDVGERVRLTRGGARTVRFADALSTPAVALMVVNVVVATGMVPTANVAEVCPAGIVTDAGVLSIPAGVADRVTVRLEATGLASVKVPVAPLPPGTELALKDRLNEFGSTCRVSVAAAPLLGVAVIVAGVCVATMIVAMVAVWLVLPAVNGTDA